MKKLAKKWLSLLFAQGLIAGHVGGTCSAESYYGKGLETILKSSYALPQTAQDTLDITVGQTTHKFWITAIDETTYGTGKDALLTLLSADDTFGKKRFNDSTVTQNKNVYSGSQIEAYVLGDVTTSLSSLSVIGNITLPRKSEDIEVLFGSGGVLNNANISKTTFYKDGSLTTSGGNESWTQSAVTGSPTNVWYYNGSAVANTEKYVRPYFTIKNCTIDGTFSSVNQLTQGTLAENGSGTNQYIYSVDADVTKGGTAPNMADSKVLKIDKDTFYIPVDAVTQGYSVVVSATNESEKTLAALGAKGHLQNLGKATADTSATGYYKIKTGTQLENAKINIFGINNTPDATKTNKYYVSDFGTGTITTTKIGSGVGTELTVGSSTNSNSNFAGMSIANGVKLTLDYDYDKPVEVYAGTATVDLAGHKLTKLATTNSAKVDLVAGNTSKLDMQNSATETISVSKLTGDLGISINIDMANGKSDKLSIASVGDSSVTIDIASIVLTSDLTGGGGTAGTSVSLPEQSVTGTITYVDGAAKDSITYTVNGSATGKVSGITFGSSGSYTYTFEGGATKGTLAYEAQRTASSGLATFLTHGYGDTVDTLNLTDNYKYGNDATSATVAGSNMTINLNDHNLKAALGKSIAITIPSGKKLSVNGGGNGAGTIDENASFDITATDGKLEISNASVAGTITNKGTLTSSASTLAGSITNDGELKTTGSTLTGVVTNGGTITATGENTFAEITGSGTVSNSGTLKIAADKLGNEVTNANTAVVELTNSGSPTLSKKIAGGIVKISGDMTATATNLAATVQLLGATKLSLGAGSLAGNITGSNANNKVVVEGAVDAGTNALSNVALEVGSSGNLTVAADKLSNITDSKITNAGTVTVNGGTLNTEIAGGSAAFSGTVETSLDKLNLSDAGTITNTGTLVLTGGTLAKDIGGAGTTEVKTGAMVNVASDVNVAGGLKLSGTLDVSGDEEYHEVSVGGNLVGNGGMFKFDADLSGATKDGTLATSEHDRLKVTGNATGTLSLIKAVTVVNGAGESLAIGDSFYMQLLNASGSEKTLTFTGTAIATSAKERYVFEKAEDFGKLKITKQYGFTLAEIVRGNSPETVGITSFDLVGDTNLNDSENNHYTVDDQAVSDLGTLNRNFTINGGKGYDLQGDATNSTPQKSGLEVASNATLTVQNVGTVEKFKDYFVKNEGNLVFEGGSDENNQPTETVLKSNITGGGAMELSADAKVTLEGGTVTQKDLTIDSGAELKADASSLVISGTFTNSGILELTGGTLSTTVTGSGTNKISGDLTIAATVNDLIVSIDDIGGDIVDNGTVTVKAGSSSSTVFDKNISGSGKVKIDDDISVTGSNLTATGGVQISADKTLMVTGERLGTAVVGEDGTTKFTGTTVGIDKNIANTVEFDTTKPQNITVDDAGYLGKSNITVNAATVLKLMAGSLQRTVTGGQMRIEGDVTLQKKQAISEFTQDAGTNLSVPLSILDKGTTGQGFITSGIDASKFTVEEGATLTITDVNETVTENDLYVLVSLANLVGDEQPWSNITTVGTSDYEFVYAASEDGEEKPVAGKIVLKAIMPNKWHQDPSVDVPGIVDTLKENNKELFSVFKTLYKNPETKPIAVEGVNTISSMTEQAAVSSNNMAFANAAFSNIAEHTSVSNTPVLAGVADTPKVMNTIAGMDMVPIEVVEIGEARDLMPQRQQSPVYGREVWASYLHGKDDINGLKSGQSSIDGRTTFNGITVGSDLWADGKGFGGLAFSYASGKVNSSNIASLTDNRTKNYGLSVYHRFDVGNNSSILADAGYGRSTNDVSLDFNLGSLVTASPKADSFYVGLRYEQKIVIDSLSTLVPFVGLRYNKTKVSEYTNSLNIKYDETSQRLFSIPIGLRWTCHSEKFHPYAELGYNWNLGGRDNDLVVQGVTLKYDTADANSYYAKIGMDYVQGNFLMGLYYLYSRSAHVKSDRWNVNLGFIF